MGSNFGVTSTGVLYASNADISGTITADKGFIGGWTIGSGYIQGGSTTLYSSGKIDAGDTTISSSGKLTANNADIEGKIVADDGEIGGWTITKTKLKSGDMSISSENGITFGDFTLDSDGVITTESIYLTNRGGGLDVDGVIKMGYAVDNSGFNNSYLSAVYGGTRYYGKTRSIGCSFGLDVIKYLNFVHGIFVGASDSAWFSTD